MCQRWKLIQEYFLQLQRTTMNIALSSSTPKTFFIIVHNILSSHVCSMVESESPKVKLKKKEYTCQIPYDNKIEPPYTENHSHMQTITSFANFCSWMSFSCASELSKIHNKIYACGYLCMHVCAHLHNSCWLFYIQNDISVWWLSEEL